MCRTFKMDIPLSPGLYIVATPIGNLSDLSPRAAEVLRGCDRVLAEDKRVSAKLLAHVGATAPMTAYHDHSSEAERDRIVAMLGDKAVALISDAGTPLISDPGYKLVRAARAAGAAIHTIPGPCAAIAALTLAGLPTDRFLFAGFLPAREKARRAVMQELAGLKATLVFYESGPRLTASLETIAEMLPGREVSVARELTKLHEECRSGAPGELAGHYVAHPPRGEIVLLVGPPQAAPVALDAAAVDALLIAELKTVKPSRAAAEVARAHGLNRKALYARALELK